MSALASPFARNASTLASMSGFDARIASSSDWPSVSTRCFNRMNGTCVLRAACARVANCSALAKPSAASGSLVPRARTGLMRAWSSGAYTGIVITSLGLGVDSGIGAATVSLEAVRATRVTRVARFGLAATVAAGDS